ncbi:MAG: cation-translocating P-type ATPase, partial [Desulfobacterales bacterium]|nr:cation-translocating P-type ATPase [Desulfobacterales bacterium]
RRLWGVQSSTTSTQRTVDQLSTYFIPGVILLATITFLWHSQSGLKTGVLVGISVLVASCPCAFGLATPLALASGIKSAVTNGILVMNVEGFEKAHDVDAFVLDKTRTLTQGG